MSRPPAPSIPKVFGQAGLTLAELIGVVALAGLLCFGLFYITAGQQRLYGARIRDVARREHLLGAMRFVTHGLRHAGAGFGGCPDGAVLRYAAGATPPLRPSGHAAIRIYNDCNLLVTPASRCPDGSGSDSLSVTSVGAPAVGAPAGVPGEGIPAMRLARPAHTSSSAIVVRTPGEFQALDLVALWDPAAAHCTLLQLTGAPVPRPPHVALPHQGGVGVNPPDSVNIFPRPDGYREGSLVIRLGPEGATAPRHISVDAASTPPRLVTWTGLDSRPNRRRTRLEVVATGIEDMQIAWACDADRPGDGRHFEGADPAARRNDEWVANVAGDTPPAGCDQPEVVRVTLVARSASATPGDADGFRPGVEDRPRGTAAEDLAMSGNTGTYARKKLTATVRLRNVRFRRP